MQLASSSSSAFPADKDEAEAERRHVNGLSKKNGKRRGKTRKKVFFVL